MANDEWWDISQRLKEPFAPLDLEWRVSHGGVSNGKPWALVLCYVTARAIQDRLDDVVGPGNWQDSYHAGPDGGVICRLSIRVNGEWITKEDGAENTQVEAVKGGVSGALKRAGAKWGIGRYLYDLKDTWAEFVERDGQYRTTVKKGDSTRYHWNPPRLPSWALPGAGPAAPPPPARTQQPPAPKATPPQDKMTAAQGKKLHAAGTLCYGSTWDDIRPKLVSSVTKGRSESSNDLYKNEAATLIDGIEKKYAERQATDEDEIPMGAGGGRGGAQ